MNDALRVIDLSAAKEAARKTLRHAEAEMREWPEIHMHQFAARIRHEIGLINADLASHGVVVLRASRRIAA